LGILNAAQASKVQPQTRLANWSHAPPAAHPSIHTASPSKAAHTHPRTVQAVVLFVIFNTLTRNVLPACCTGASKVMAVGV